jgi:hypothetical protein
MEVTEIRIAAIEMHFFPNSFPALEKPFSFSQDFSKLPYLCVNLACNQFTTCMAAKTNTIALEINTQQIKSLPAVEPVTCLSAGIPVLPAKQNKKQVGHLA